MAAIDLRVTFTKQGKFMQTITYSDVQTQVHTNTRYTHVYIRVYLLQVHGLQDMCTCTIRRYPHIPQHIQTVLSRTRQCLKITFIKHIEIVIKTTFIKT